jgi:hypothetical protein
MSVENRGPFEQRLASVTARFLDQLEACVGSLPVLLDRYAAGEPIESVVESISERESDCDRTNREFSRLISGSSVRDLGIRLTRVHLHSGQIIELYQLLDEIADHLEQFATELAAIDPPRQEQCVAGLREMADHCVAGMAVLSNAVDQYVRALCQPAESLSITEQIARIRELESESDRLRDVIIADAFREGPTATSMVYFQLATRLNTVLDTIEDVTDQMLLVTGNQDWIEIEPAAYPD